MHSGQTKNAETISVSPGEENVGTVAIQNGSTKNLEDALMAIGNAGFGDRSIKISVVTIEVNAQR